MGVLVDKVSRQFSVPGSSSEGSPTPLLDFDSSLLKVPFPSVFFCCRRPQWGVLRKIFVTSRGRRRLNTSTEGPSPVPPRVYRSEFSDGRDIWEESNGGVEVEVETGSVSSDGPQTVSGPRPPRLQVETLGLSLQVLRILAPPLFFVPNAMTRGCPSRGFPLEAK